MSLYPRKIWDVCKSPRNAGFVDHGNVVGVDASFICGSFVSFSIRVEPETKIVSAAAFQTNGCGYMTAAADVLAETVKNKHLSELHGLKPADLNAAVEASLGVFDKGRRQCADCCISALRSAFADYRKRQIEEFHGEKALICTCFGVSEETIDHHIETGSLRTVDDVAQVCRAGGGCGSCRMLIQEMLDRLEFQV